MKVEAPTRSELEALQKDLFKRKTKLLDMYKIFGGGEMFNVKHEVINKSLDKVKEQLRELEQDGDV